MLLLVGLGNPGPEHAANRHNIGFMAVDAIVRRHDFSGRGRRFRAELAEGRLGLRRVLALKPMTYMNLSGEAVGEAARFYRIPPGNVVVFHDELDLPPGRIRMKKGGGHAGHNGLRSIEQHLGPEYRRCRIGIGHPGDKALVARYVLMNFAKGDHDWIDPLVAALAEEAPLLAADEDTAYASRVALRLNPPKPKGPAAEEKV